jgi:hypothetical protein
MKSLLKSRKGLSTVVTTLIILVVSVLLATVVTFYAINVTTTRVQEESIQVTKLHFWNNGSTFSEAAFLIINTGGRDLVLDKIAVRGQQSEWDTVYFNKTQTGISPDLTYITPNANGTLQVYMTNPDSLSVNDIGVTLGVTIFTANAQYYKESNVEAAT